MAVNLIKAGTEEAISTTLDGAIQSDDTTITLTSSSGLQAPGVVVIDRQDASGNDTPSEREYVYYTGISTNDLTGCDRGQGGSTAQAHNDGAVVEEVMTAMHWEGLRTCVAAGHTDAGTGLHLSGTASVAIVQSQKILSSTASVGSLTAGTITGTTLNATNLIGGVKGQFVWTQLGSLVTSQATLASDDHIPFMRARKNLTINSCWVGVMSAPSTAALGINIDYRSTPTSTPASIFSTAPTVDVGEPTTDTAATAAALSLTSLASGTLLQPSISSPGGAGDLTITLNCTERS